VDLAADGVQKVWRINEFFILKSMCLNRMEIGQQMFQID
jgi:hypothetical protein